MDVLSLNLSPRTVTGKKVKRLRRQGLVPVHVYGTGIPPLSLQVENKVLTRVLPRVGTNIPLSVEIEGREGEDICFVREVQRHPVTEDILHVDFMRVDVEQTIRSEIPIIVEGVSPAVQLMGGTLLQPQQSILVESLPMNVPPSISVNISDLDDFDKGIYVRDVSVDSNVTILTDLESLLARVSPPRIELVEEEDVEEGAEGEEAPAAEEDTEG